MGIVTRSLTGYSTQKIDRRDCMEFIAYGRGVNSNDRTQSMIAANLLHFGIEGNIIAIVLENL